MISFKTTILTENIIGFEKSSQSEWIIYNQILGGFPLLIVLPNRLLSLEKYELNSKSINN
jgi:hypothetical protein